MLRSSLALVGLLALASPAHAENKLVKCDTGIAKRTPMPEGPALYANAARSMRPIPLNAAQFTDKPLSKRMVVEEIFRRTLDAGNTEVTARFVNCKKDPVAIKVRVSFLDADNYPLENTSAWKTIFLPAKGTGVYREVSIATKNVENFLLEVGANN